MKPRTVWLAMNEEDTYDAQVFKSRPKAVKVKPSEGVPMSCGVECCGWATPPSEGGEVTYEGRRGADSLTDLCLNGLKSAGIRIKPGQLLKLTISAEVVK